MRPVRPSSAGIAGVPRLPPGAILLPGLSKGRLVSVLFKLYFSWAPICYYFLVSVGLFLARLVLFIFKIVIFALRRLY